MSNHENKNCLSPGDALFLYLEREGTPLNVGSVCIFDGIIPLQDCSDFIESKLPLIPRYRQRVMAPPYNIGLPTWEYDREFDMRNHMHEVSLRRGTEAALKTVAGRIMSATLDRRHPLWDFTLVRGLRGNRTAIVFRVHHCLVDGVAGVAMMSVIMDASPVPPPPPQKRDFVAPPARDSFAVLLNQLITASFSSVQRLLTAQSEVLTLTKQVVDALGKPQGGGEAPLPSSDGAQIKSVADLLDMVPELTAPAERLPFNVVCRGPQQFSWTEIPMAEIKAIRHACEVTVNDVVLTIVTAAVRRYAELHGVPLNGRLLRIVVPVNVRGNGDTNELGNRITFLPVAVPLDVRDPRKLIAAVHQRMEFLKNARIGELVGSAGSLLGTIPPALQAVLGPIASQLPLTLCNLICTNVPGPQVPLYLLGHKLLQWYPYVPIGGEMGINCAVLSYEGLAYFGFTGDAYAAPDSARMEGFLEKSFAELRKAARVTTRVQKPAPKKTQAAAVPAPVAERALVSAPRQKRTPRKKMDAAAVPAPVAEQASTSGPAEKRTPKKVDPAAVSARAAEPASVSVPVPFPALDEVQPATKEEEEFQAAASV
jgi:diacylglycerol O-acyltransferase